MIQAARIIGTGIATTGLIGAGVGIGVVFGPLLQAAIAEEVAVVFQQLLLAGAGHVGQLEFEFLRRAGNLAAFDDVLFAGAGGLDHLVVGAVFFSRKRRQK